MGSRISWSAAVGGAALVAVAGLALGGAAARPGGLLLGIPAPWTLGLLLAGGLLGAAFGSAAAAAALGLGLLPTLGLLLGGLVLPGVRAVSGPPLWALVLAAVTLALSQAKRRMPRSLFLPLVFCLYAGVAARVQIQVGTQGDEPHYLMVADTLWREGGLSLERAYAQGRYQAFHDGPLEPHYRVRGKHGEIYSLHAVGLSLLLLPAYAWGGYPAASFLMALLAALLVREIRELIGVATGSETLSAGMGWVVALSPPLVHYAGLIFTEVPAALILALVLRRAWDSSGWKVHTALGLGSAAAFLPWLNVRYAPLALLLFAYALWSRPRRRLGVLLLIPGAVSALGIAVYHSILYGFFDPRRVYGPRPEMSLATIPEGLPGLLLDQEFGLLVYAPVFALALFGFSPLWRKDRRHVAAALALLGAVLLTASAWHMWRGGHNPPGRLLVPVLPVLALLAGLAVGQGLGAGRAVLIGWSLWLGLLGGWEPRLVHRDRDGTAPVFRAFSGAEEWTRLLPGYVLAHPDRSRLTLLWAGILLWAGRRGRSPATPVRFAGAALGLVAAAGAASLLSTSRTGGRDAVRLLGQPVLDVPGWTWGPRPARWEARDLDWGPLYEPHRYPGGAEVGSRLPLMRGRFRILVEAEDLAPGRPPPVLLLRVDRPQGGEGEWPLAGMANGWQGTFEVREEAATNLLVRGGGPFLLRSLSLESQP